MNRKGALAYQSIKEILGVSIFDAQEENIKPSSIDLTLNGEMYEVEGILKPGPNETVREVLGIVRNHKHPITEPLRKGKVYLALLNEYLNLPRSVYAYANPKSSSGRVDVHVRLIADGMSGYDTVSRGAKSLLWLVIVPKTFDVLLSPGLSLNQLRFFNEDTRFVESDLEITMLKDKLVWTPYTRLPISYEALRCPDSDGLINLSLDLSGEVLGYRARQTKEVIDLSKIGAYRASDFFDVIEKQRCVMLFQRDEFYILSSFEMVRVPPHLACEMIPMHERYGEFRSHYAGFIDPGWGWGKEGEGIGRQLTLEVRPFEDVIARHNDPFAKIRFERLTEVPDAVYDGIPSNYSIQSGPKLGKYFFE